MDAMRQEALDGFDIDTGGLEQLLAQGAAQFGHRLSKAFPGDVQDFADQGETIGVDAGGGEADEDIAFRHGRAVQHMLLVGQPHGEAGQIILVLRIEAGHLSGLTAHQGTSRLAAALHHAGDDGLNAAGHVLPHRQIVQEKEGTRPGTDNIVDTHGHAVDAYGVVLVCEEGDLQLGAHAVGAGDQHGLFHTGYVGGEQAAEAAQRADDARNIGGLHQGLDTVNGLIAGGHVHTGGGVGIGSGNRHSGTSLF